jgi:GT2 family glycosyltransferase
MKVRKLGEQPHSPPLQMEVKNSVAAVVVTWNSARDIGHCLLSLQAQTHRLKTVVVVDNASSDGTVDLVREQYPWVDLIRRDRNEGFARGNNIGITATISEWVLTVNPDACLATDYVERLLDFTRDKPRAGALGGKLIRVNDLANISQAETPDSGKSIIDTTGIEIFRSRRVRDRDFMRMDEGRRREPERVFGICAAAALYSREMLTDTAVNGEVFPEAFVSYYEDADLAWRAWRRGWEAWYVPPAVGWHRRGGSAAGAGYSRYLTHRNRWWLIARNETMRRTLRVLPEVMAHEALMALRLLRHPYLFKAVWETMHGLPRAERERGELKDLNHDQPPFKKGVGFG